MFCSGGSLDLVKTYEDIEEFRRATGAASVMLARAAMWNASVFSSQGLLPVERVMEEYLKYVSRPSFTRPKPNPEGLEAELSIPSQAIRYDNHAFNTKYCLCQMLRDKVESPLGKQVQAAQTNTEIRCGVGWSDMAVGAPGWCLFTLRFFDSEALGLQEFYRQTEEKLQTRREAVQSSSPPSSPVVDGDVVTMAVKFERSVCSKIKDIYLAFLKCLYFNAAFILNVISVSNSYFFYCVSNSLLDTCPKTSS